MPKRSSSMLPARCSTSPATKRSRFRPTRGCASNGGAPSGNAFRDTVCPTLSSSAEIAQRRLRVDQLVEVDDRLLADQALDVVEHVPDVDVHSGQHPVLAVEPERQELPAVDITAE